MKSLNRNITPGEENEFEENILVQREFKTYYNNKTIFISLLKAKEYILIRSSFYEIKLYPNNFEFVIGNKTNNLDEAYNFLENIFISNNFFIKSISNKSIKLSLIRNYSFENQKEIELELAENIKQNYLVLIKDLYNKYSNIENELIEIKNQNSILINENLQLKNKINFLEIQNNQAQMNMNNQNNMMMQNMMINMNLNNNNFQNQNNINNFNNNNNFFQQKNENIVIVEDEIYKKPSPIFIFLYFRCDIINNSHPVMIRANIDEKVSELIRRYELKVQINDNENFKYIFNEKDLDKNMKVKKAGLVNNSYIFAVPLKEEEKKEINNELNSFNNSNKNDISDEPERDWALIDIKSSNNGYIFGNIIVFIDITIKTTRHILTISTPKGEKFKHFFEVIMKYLNLYFVPYTNNWIFNWIFIFNNNRINPNERKTLLEYEIKDLDHLIIIEK